jgi:hypothetical protein
LPILLDDPQERGGVADLLERLQTALGEAYHVERELGGGGMSRVFLAEETALGRKVVVKVLPPEMGAGVNAERFRREIQLAASLQHPHIVPLLNAGQANELVWYTMPLIEGESLRARLARERELPVPDAVRLMRDVADALAYAHSHGVVHRDIKPDNVLITGHHAVVTDFGVAKAISAATGESHLTSIGVALGTPAYMAPEQAAAEPHVDHRADLYALGAMSYEMLTGAPPFTGSAQLVLAAHVTQAPENVSARRTAVPSALATIVMRCLEKKAADRWQNAQELHQQLDLLATPSGGTTPTSAVPATWATARVRRSWRVPAAAAAVLLALAGGGYALWRTRHGAAPAADVREPVLVLPFEARVTSPDLKDISQLAADRIESAIEAATLGTVKQRRSVVGASESSVLSPDQLNRIAKSSGAATLVTGIIYQRGDSLEVQAQVVRARDLKTVYSLSAERSAATDPGRAIDAEKERVLGAIGLYLSRVALSDVTLTRPPSSLASFRAWSECNQVFARGDMRKAITQCSDVIRRDSAQFDAAGLVAAAYWNLGRLPESDSVLRILETRRNNLTRGELLALDWQLSFRQSPEEEHRAATAGFATDSVGWAYPAMLSSVRANRPAEALRYYKLRDTTGLWGHDWQAWYSVAANALHALGRYADELVLARESRARDQGNVSHAATEARALIALGRTADLERLLTASRALPNYRAPGSLMYQAGFELYEHGGKAQANAMWERSLAWHQALPPDRRKDRAVRERMATASYYIGRYDEAGRFFADLAREFPDVPLYVNAVARIAASQGDTAAALRRVEQLRADTAHSNGMDIARIYALLGHKEEAVAALRDYLNHGGRYAIRGWHATSFELMSLRGYPPFEALVALKDSDREGAQPHP